MPWERPGVQVRKSVDQSHEEEGFEMVLNTLVLINISFQSPFALGLVPCGCGFLLPADFSDLL